MAMRHTQVPETSGQGHKIILSIVVKLGVQVADLKTKVSIVFGVP